MGPSRIVAVRHGQSEANLAYEQSHGTPLVYERGDEEVTLTELGRAQAAALGRFLAALPPGEAPEVVWCSPYRRALDTWAVAGRAWGAELPLHVDARLRDREMGRLARLNRAAIGERFPEELARWRAAGEYGYRPPGGESFGDVAVRLREFWGELRVRADGRRVLIVAHDSVVLILRHVIAGTPDAELAAIAVHGPIRNASVSTWGPVDGRLEVVAFNEVAHLDG
ncbi:histidine phosphatase family protein [Thermoactinospora rubra]|uniref:histidine phosphatase family protein n=1 Tax=Thermoactinospora rubra TaxID=1088767 RepID=UPI000A1158AC|nr:histidine phosphatase family protein [Thermoactinospora rubra]